MQGRPLAMVAYGISILPLTNNLKREISDVTHPWYAEDAVVLGKFVIIEVYFNSLTRQGLGRGYYSKPSKSVMIVYPYNIEDGKELGAHHGFKVCTALHYLGGYIGDDKSKSDWLREHTLTWEKKLTLSAKPRVNIPRRVMPRWYMQSNQSGYFYNTSPGTWGVSLQEWIK